MRPRRLLRLLPALLLLAAGFIYWPGTGGGFLFDDFPNIVDNQDLDLASLSPGGIIAASFSSSAGEFKRPLATLSFALGNYFLGRNAVQMKAINIAIHLANGLLLYFLILRLRAVIPSRHADGARWEALLLTGCWLLLPINVSSVLYIVQRMELLSNTAVLAGLLGFMIGRQRLQQQHRGIALCAASIVFGTAIGLLSKESALLLPLYAFIADWALYGCRTPNRAGQYRLIGLYSFLLLLPTILGMTWLLPRVLASGAYDGRPFTLGQRLLTETRVVWDYVQWCLIPLPHSLSFYHDDIPISTGIFSPLTTVLSVIGWIATIAIAVILRKTLPLASLGIGWFIAAQALTATIVPLEIAFEHRNYFASIGLLIAASALLLRFTPRGTSMSIAVAALAFYAVLTTLRVQDWSNPLRFAHLEADQHPNSPRAHYELGRLLLQLSDYRIESPFLEPALTELEAAAKLPNSSILPDSSLIFAATYTHQPIMDKWWTRMHDKLSQRPTSTEDLSALHQLVECESYGPCVHHTLQMEDLFITALEHSPPSPRLLLPYANFADSQLHDFPLAERLTADLIARDPRDIELRIQQARILYDAGDSKSAQEVMQTIPENTLSSYDTDRVRRLKNLLSEPAK